MKISSCEVESLLADRNAGIVIYSVTSEILAQNKKISRRDAKAQRARKVTHQLENLSFFLCVTFAALRLCVRFYFWFRLVRVGDYWIVGLWVIKFQHVTTPSIQ
jgi:hypothetical protein